MAFWFLLIFYYALIILWIWLPSKLAFFLGLAQRRRTLFLQYFFFIDNSSRNLSLGIAGKKLFLCCHGRDDTNSLRLSSPLDIIKLKVFHPQTSSRPRIFGRILWRQRIVGNGYRSDSLVLNIIWVLPCSVANSAVSLDTTFLMSTFLTTRCMG